MTDATSPVLYVKLADELRSQIASGALAMGDPLLSTAKLTERYGVSSTVARKAVEVLRNEGLVRGQPGKAVYVVAQPGDAERATVEGLAHQVRELQAEVRVLNERVGAGRSDKDLAAEVEELRGLVEQLYNRLGHPYPNSDSQSEPKLHHRTGS